MQGKSRLIISITISIMSDLLFRAQLSKANQTCGVFFEALCAVNKAEKVEEVAPETMAAGRDILEKMEIYTPYNIPPLDSTGACLPVMQLEENKASVSALQNTCGLNWPSLFEQHRLLAGDLNLLDWLRAMFSFQACILHLNRMGEIVMKNLFKNYKNGANPWDENIVYDFLKIRKRYSRGSCFIWACIFSSGVKHPMFAACRSVYSTYFTIWHMNSMVYWLEMSALS